MTTLAFDTLAFSKKLKLSGFTDLQAETQAEAMAELIEGKIATKQDISDLKIATKQDIDNLRISTRQDIDNLKIATKQDIGDLKKDMLKDMLMLKKDMLIGVGSMIAGAVVVLPAIFKLISLI